MCRKLSGDEGAVMTRFFIKLRHESQIVKRCFDKLFFVRVFL